MQKTEFSKELTSLSFPIAEGITNLEYQGNEIESRDQYRERKEVEVSVFLQNMEQNYAQGKNLFIKNNPNVADFFSKIDKSMTTKGEIDPLLLTEQVYQELLSTGEKCFAEKQFESLQIMMQTLILLFPKYLQSYIILANAICVEKGHSVAAEVYEKLIEHIEDPLLYSCAASCFVECDSESQKTKGINLFKKVITMITGNPEKYADYQYLQPEIESFIKNLSA
ncbi:MAG: hypothetical protein A2007_01245 [Verrucomicrobia bacterium GWC2_42_7]|nr:MAG: hypothetical protein A2007_01245 [Verrucomicrobia bacterium GWC2_42_7]